MKNQLARKANIYMNDPRRKLTNKIQAGGAPSRYPVACGEKKKNPSALEIIVSSVSAEFRRCDDVIVLYFVR